jgi:hypothetical protein
MRFRIAPFVLAAAALGRPADVPAQARIGFQAGLVSATLGGEDAGSPGSRLGVHAGAFVAIPLTPVFTLQGGVGWAQKGIEEQIDVDVTAQVAFSYFQIPLIARFAIPSNAVVGAYLLAGPVLSLEVSCNVEIDAGQSGTASADCDSPLLAGGIPTKSTDIGLLFGGGISLLPRGRISYFLQIAYELGLKSIDDSNPSFDVKNRAVLLSAGIAFSLGG